MNGTRNPLRDLADQTGRKNIPFTAVLELTYRCNLRCRHCYCVPLKEPEAKTAQIEGFLDQLAMGGVLVLSVTGGEIHLRPDLFAILKAASDRNFAIGLFTNLVDWTGDELRRLREYPVYIVETSLYGASPETHDAFTRSEGSFQSTLSSIHRLIEIGIPVMIKTMWTRWNFREYPAVMGLIRDLRASCPDANPERVQFQGSKTISPRRDGEMGVRDCVLRDEELAEFLRVVLRDSGDAKSLYDRFCSASTEEGDAPDRPCGAGLSSVRVDPRGVVYPCADIELEAGDLRTQPFMEIWKTSSLLQELRNKALVNPECTACEIKGFCTRCPGDALKEKG
ncbi:MAG: radical SAM protein, partial [Planctomycetota bacterium]